MKSLRALAGIFLVVAAFYVAFKVVPPYMNEYEFEDAIGQVARYSSYNQQKTEQDVRDEVFKKAQDCSIPVTAEQIHVQRNGPELSIWTDYTVHIDLPGYPLDLQFHPNSKNRRI